MTPLIIIQSRMGSARFPGKVLAPLCGQPMLLWQLLRLTMVPGCDVVVATPQGEDNAPLWRLLDTHGYLWMAPEVAEDDVLGRFYEVARRFPTETILRVTGDTPLLDPVVVQSCLAVYQSIAAPPDALKHVGIAAQWPDGQDVEVFSMAGLAAAQQYAADPSDREHVTPWLWRSNPRVISGLLACPLALPSHQYSVDTRDDLALVERLLHAVLATAGIGFSWLDVYRACLADRSLLHAMQHRTPRNQAYVTQVGASSWEEARYRPHTPSTITAHLEG